MTEKPKSSPSAPDLTYCYAQQKGNRYLWIVTKDHGVQYEVLTLRLGMVTTDVQRDQMVEFTGPIVAFRTLGQNRQLYNPNVRLTDAQIVLLHLKSYDVLYSQLNAE